ncbi:hypothetical protein LWI29_021018 [Acer saccharum]|uniref:Exportin-2 central domain-containing protein n=1 Tax=Acer saccharum TaxID=4024 RepID=A0AA39T5E5_ACESA|nr:hypothetical protein LWI29_021018 [Acer saccharum]
MKELMGEFKKYLTTIYPALESSGDGLGLVDALEAAVCENISLYMERNEEFQGYLNDFALAVWTLLGNVSQSSARDRLAVTAIKFLSTVSRSVHGSLYFVFRWRSDTTDLSEYRDSKCEVERRR